MGGELEGGFELVLEGLHVAVDGAIKPFLVLFGGEGADQAQAALLVGEDAHDLRAPLEFLVEPFEEVGAPEVVVVCPRLAVEGPRLLDAFLDPGAELGIPGLPAAEPDVEVPAGLGQVAAVVEPAQLGQAGRIGGAGQMVEGVAQESRRPRAPFRSGHPRSGRDIGPPAAGGRTAPVPHPAGR